MHYLSRYLDKASKHIYKRKGFYNAAIITDWEKIVGKNLSNNSSPQKIIYPKNSQTNGTLYIDVFNSGLALEMSYLEPIIIEKLSTYFGFKSISKIKICQKPKKIQTIQKIVTTNKPDISDENQQKLDNLLEELTESDLLNPLKSLGETIFSGKSE